MTNFSMKWTDAFVAIVVGPGLLPDTWEVLPSIAEVDGTDHPSITVGARDGITPTPGDTVLILTMRNPLDLTAVSRYYTASESNGVIVGVMAQTAGYVLTGDYTFLGNVIIDGDLSITGGLTVVGNATIGGDANLTGELTASDAVFGIIRFSTHKHVGSPTAPPGAVSPTGVAIP